MSETPYRERPEPGKLSRWYYWSPAHWRRWQVLGVVLLGLGALGRRAGCAGCFTPKPPASMRTDEGKPGWYLRASDIIELQRRAGSLCPDGWKKVEQQFNAWGDDEYIIECRQKGQPQ